MIIKTNFVPRGFDAITVFPFIIIRPESADNASLIAHEMVHYREQKAAWVVPWLLRYAFSSTFRLAAEVRGYQAQIAMGGITVDQAVQMLQGYRLNVSAADARVALIGGVA